MKKMVSLLVALMTAGVVCAELLPPLVTENGVVSIASHTDERGYFHYTFDGGTNSFACFDGASFELKVGVVDHFSVPEGWDTSWEGDSLLVSMPEGALLNERHSISFLSYSSQVFELEGIIFGNVWAAENSPVTGGGVVSQNIVGYSKFDYLSPIPEPSTSAFLMVAGVGLAVWRRKRRW